jgi:glycosyltransferase involved in cell wall biosynthesis
VRRIGYFVPEFPGQTHIFFWRELAALKARGVEPELVSTRRPPQRLISHSWAREAMTRTVYLLPPGVREIGATIEELARTAPAGWGRCATSIARAEGLSAARRLRLVGLALMGSRLAALARDRGWTHIHAHSCAETADTAMFASLLSGLPYSLTLHGPLSDYGPNQREKWRHARFAVVITRKLRREVEEALSGSLPPSVEIAPMGVELRRFTRRTPYQPWNGTGPLRIFSCGRLNPCKGHQDLIRAVQLLRDRGIDAQAAIAGEDEAGGTSYRRVLAAQIAAKDLSDSAVLLGAVSEDRVRDELERAHVFTLASLREPLGVAIMEAMAMRTPVVVTGAGGVPELVDDGVDGLLVRPERPLELADRIETVARDPALARRLGDAGRRKVESEFDSGRSAEILAQHILHG